MYSGMAELVVASSVYEVQCVVTLNYYPNNQIQYRIIKQDEDADKFFHEIFYCTQLVMRFQGKQLQVSIMSTRTEMSYDKHVKVEIILVNEFMEDYRIGGERTDVDHVVFQLYNFPEFRCNDFHMAKEGLNACSVYSLHLRLLEYYIDVQSHRSTKTAFETLNLSGGFQSTHLVHVRRFDAQKFSLQDIKLLVEIIEYYLSFVSGEFTRLVCPICITDERIVCEKLDFPIHAYHLHLGCVNFFQLRPSENHPIETLFNEHFCKFASNWHKESTLGRSVNMYCQANHQKYIDTSLLLIQSGMETLAYNLFVEKEHTQKIEFENAYAPVKLTMLLSAACIPLSVNNYSGNFTHIKEVESSKTKINNRIIHLFITTRNSLVHADNSFYKESGMTTDNIAELQQIMLHIFELCILYVLGYRGTYVNRLKQRRVGEVELVPWAQN
jgi:hypothetical protein